MTKLTFFAGLALGWSLSAALLTTSVMGSCPARFALGQLKPLPEDAKRHQMMVYRLVVPPTRAPTSKQPTADETKSTPPPTTWQRVTSQLDPFDDEGLLQLPKKGGTPLLGQNVTPQDRLVFEAESFGPKATTDNGMPCTTSKLYELANPYNKDEFVYVAACRDAPTILSPAGKVRFLPKQNQIVTDAFIYEYFPKNELLYQSMRVKHPKTGEYIGAGSKSGYMLYLDVANFFDITFGAHEFLTRNEYTHVGPIGGVARIALLKRFLGMKLDLKLITIASFYNASANVPMVVDVPVHSPRWLNPGSGMLATWIPDEAKVDFNHPDTNFPFADTELIQKGNKAMAKRGLELCTKSLGDNCQFSFVGKLRDLPTRVTMNVPKEMVRQGFFPSFVTDVDQFKKDLDWDSDPDPAPKGTMGMYFDNSGLPKGRYNIDYWVQLGDVATHACPHPVTQVQVLTVPDMIEKVSH